jgi:hypothetical protein
MKAKVMLVALMTLSATAQSPSANDAEHNHNAHGGKVLLLPSDLEIRLAVNALPKELREGASVLVLESDGYVKVRSGTNSFTCIVSRRGGNFYPVCFDEEGARTILPAFADDAVFRMKVRAKKRSSKSSPRDSRRAGIGLPHDLASPICCPLQPIW